jgi:hypothetical protein
VFILLFFLFLLMDGRVAVFFFCKYFDSFTTVFSLLARCRVCSLRLCLPLRGMDGFDD